MDKASIIKDAIEYIESLNNEEQRIQAEILELESGGAAQLFYSDHQAESTAFSASKPIKRSRTMENYYDSCVSSSAPSSNSFVMPPSSPIELLEVSRSLSLSL